MEKRFGTITCVVTAHVSALNGTSFPLPAKLQYGVTAPYAVRLSLGPATGPTASWVFARELLADGPRRPTGPGDVLVLPRCGHRPHSTRIALMNTHGAATIEMPSTAVAAFLRRTFSLVPLGTEGQYLDLDGAITALMGRSHHS